MNPSVRAAGSSSNGTVRGMKSLFYRRGPARLGSARRTETSLLATRRWKLESRACTDRPQEQPPLEWHERRVHRVRPSALALFLRLSPFLVLSLRFFLSSRLFPLTPAAFINPEPTVHASGSDDTANICPPILRRSRTEWKRKGRCLSTVMMKIIINLYRVVHQKNRNCQLSKLPGYTKIYSIRKSI